MVKFTSLLSKLPNFDSLMTRLKMSLSSADAADINAASGALSKLNMNNVPVQVLPDPVTGKYGVYVGAGKKLLTSDALNNLDGFLKSNLTDIEYNNLYVNSSVNLPAPAQKRAYINITVNQKPAVNAELGKAAPDVASRKAKWNSMVTGSAILKTVFVGSSAIGSYLAYERLQDMMDKQNGCWLYNVKTDQNIRKISSEQDATHCKCASNEIKSGLEAIVAQACMEECIALNPETSGGVLWPACTTKCGCASNTEPPVLLGDDMQIGIRTVQKDMTDVLGDVMAEFGGFLKGIGNGVLDVVFDAFETVMGKFSGIFTYVGIALGGLLIIGLAIYLGVKQPWRKPTTIDLSLKGGTAASSLWGGGSVFYIT